MTTEKLKASPSISSSNNDISAASNIRSSLDNLSPSSSSKKASPNRLVVPCVVCGSARSSGIHFGAITCEACKAFFHRALVSSALAVIPPTVTTEQRLVNTYECIGTTGLVGEGVASTRPSRSDNPQLQQSSQSTTERCDISEKVKYKCQRCRLEKCIEVGMVPQRSAMGRPSKARLAELSAELGLAVEPGRPLARLPVGNPRGRPSTAMSGSNQPTSQPSPPTISSIPKRSKFQQHPTTSAASVDPTADGASNDETYSQGLTTATLRHSGLSDESEESEGDFAWDGTQGQKSSSQQRRRSIPMRRASANASDIPPDNLESKLRTAALNPPVCGRMSAPAADTIHWTTAADRMREAAMNPSKFLWLYDSATSGWFDVTKLPETGSIPDPLQLLPKYILKSEPAAPELTPYDLWVRTSIQQFIEAIRHLANINQIRITHISSTGPTPIKVMIALLNDPFESTCINTINFVKTLWQWFKPLTREDRSTLMWNCYAGIRVASLSLSFDEVHDDPITDWLQPVIYRNLIAQCPLLNDLLRTRWALAVEAGRTIKSAKLTIVEFGLLCALIYFDADCPGLTGSAAVQQASRHLVNLSEAFIRNTFSATSQPGDAFQSADIRLTKLKSLVTYFQGIHKQMIASGAAMITRIHASQPEALICSGRILHEAIERMKNSVSH